jgi:hypothetical protein
MAGRGPAPKDHRQRARDEKPVERLPAEHTGEVPPLPPFYRHSEAECEFLETTREWYAHWARSPMASRFTEVEWDRLRLVVAPLMDQFVRTSKSSLAGEVRLQEASLGATAVDRQRLRWKIDEPKPAAQPPSDDLRAEYDQLLAKRLARRGT